MWKVLGHRPSEEELAIGLEPERVIEQELVSQVVDEILRPAIEASHQTQQEIMTEMSGPVAEQVQERNVFSRDRVKWEACQLQDDYLEMARKQIREVTGVITKFSSVCSCGCKIKSTVNFEHCCVKCSKPKVGQRNCVYK